MKNPGVVFLVLFIIALTLVGNVATIGGQPPIGIDDMFTSPISHGEPGFRKLWEFTTAWHDIGPWTLITRWDVWEDVSCSPDPCMWIIIVNKDYAHGRGWESYDSPETCVYCLSNYLFSLYTNEWGLSAGDEVVIDLYWTDQPPPYYLSDLLHMGALTQTVPLHGKSGNVINDDEWSWNEVDNTIVATFTITYVEDRTGTTFEVRKSPRQWLPPERRPQIEHDYPGPVCSFEWPSGGMSGYGCVDSWYSSSTAPFTAVLTVKAVPDLHWKWYGVGNETKCTPAIFETDGQEHWWISNTGEQLYCGPIPWYTISLPLIIRDH